MLPHLKWRDVMRNISGILKNSILVTLLLLLGKIISFLRDIVISACYGASDSTDAYFAANNIPTILFTAFITSLLMFFIPIYVERREKAGQDAAECFMSNLLNIFLPLTVLLSIGGVIFSDFLVHLAAPGFTGEKLTLTVMLSRLMCLSFPFSLLMLLFASYVNARGYFAISQTTALVSALVVIAGVWFGSAHFGIWALIYSALAAAVINTVLQFFSARRFYRHRWVFEPRSAEIRKMCILAFPVFIGLTADEINIFVNGMICSFLSGNALSCLNYSQRLIMTVNGTVVTGVLTVLYPQLSAMVAKNDFSQIVQIVNKSIVLILIGLTPVFLILFLHSREIIRLVYYRGAFDENALVQTSLLLACYAIGIIFMAFREFFTRIFYAMQNAKAPAMIGVLGVGVNIISCLILVRFFKVQGLAVAAVFSSALSAFLLFIWIRKQLSAIGWKPIVIGPRAGIALFTAVSGMIATWFVLHFLLDMGRTHVTFLAALLIELVVYVILVLSFRLEEINFLTTKIWKRKNV